MSGVADFGWAAVDADAVLAIELHSEGDAHACRVFLRGSAEGKGMAFILGPVHHEARELAEEDVRLAIAIWREAAGR